MSKYRLNTIKLTVVSFLILSLALLFQLFINNSNHKSFVEKSKIENLALQNQIDVILVKYDSITALYDANAKPQGRADTPRGKSRECPGGCAP